MILDAESYVTLMPTLTRGRWLVAVMEYHTSQDEYTIRKTSDPLDRKAAMRLAAQWAKSYGVEVRL